MNDKKTEFLRAIKYKALALPLAVISPIIITIGFKAVKANNYIFITLGFILAVGAVLLGIKGIRIVLNALFK